MESCQTKSTIGLLKLRAAGHKARPDFEIEYILKCTHAF